MLNKKKKIKKLRKIRRISYDFIAFNLSHGSRFIIIIIIFLFFFKRKIY